MVNARPYPVDTPAENHARGNAIVGRSRSPDLLFGLSLQPFDGDQRRSMARPYSAVRSRAAVRLSGVRPEGRRYPAGLGLGTVPAARQWLIAAGNVISMIRYHCRTAATSSRSRMPAITSLGFRGLSTKPQSGRRPLRRWSW